MKVSSILVPFLFLTICYNNFEPIKSEFVITPLFTTMYRYQFYAVVMPYMVREYQRKNIPSSGIRKLKETDPDIEPNLEGRTAIITGGSRGLGVEVVRTFLRKGAHVITTSSSNDKQVAEQRYAKITKNIPPGKWKLDIWYLDLMSMESVLEFVERFKMQPNASLNYFIGNAGVMFPKYRISKDGFESQQSINYLGHALMTFHLLPYLYETSKQTNVQSRIVLTSSCLHHIPARIRWHDLQSVQVYSPHYAYGLSKLSVIMFINRLSRTLKSKGDIGQHVKAFTVHPGLVDTDLLNTIEIVQQYPQIAHQVALRDVKEGAETTIYAALSSELDRFSGRYLEDSQLAVSSRLSNNEDLQDRLWTVTARLLSKWTDDEWFDNMEY
ncbi:hypothetical protein BLOT_005639 [Blomia tropicalis]|nr:hypothetical protein BLOT_005639 [Blomia tropicalis]